MVANVSTGIQSGPGVQDGDTVALRCVGSTISAILNGVTVIAVTATALTAGTVWGVQIPNDSRVRIDDLRVLDA